MGLLLFYPTPVFEKEDAMPEDFNKKLERARKQIDKLNFIRFN